MYDVRVNKIIQIIDHKSNILAIKYNEKNDTLIGGDLEG